MRAFFDTNILVYLYDADAPDKKDRACELFEAEAASGRVILSTQVLQEFYVAVTRKLAVPLRPEVAEDVVRNLSVLPVVRIGSEIILTAIGRSRRLKYSFWDALIVEAALAGGADRLLTEDLQHGQVIDGLRIENPFL
ncbi:MAG: PIN domain-containing protein [Desulfobacteraceae bacterium]|nr:PIN domain-containing protein [Desulfobacteraceae bacterium]